MKITIIHGQNHKGSTPAITRELAGVQRKIHKKTDALAKKLRAGVGKRGENARGRKWFYIMRLFHKVSPPAEPDFGYWERRGWHGRQRPWKQRKGE